MHSQFRLLAMEALKLPVEEREAFVQLLIASFDADAEIEDAWAIEVERRIADIENGNKQLIPIHDALATVRAGLK
jgi:putative addiction module component (TIGR02574 family)